jgi:hypothetical protein
MLLLKPNCLYKPNSIIKTQTTLMPLMEVYPFQLQIIMREELAYRYALALDEEDIYTLAEVIAVANDDPKLSKLIDEIDIAFAYP